MYAIKNKKTKKWLFGTDFTKKDFVQRTSKEQALTYIDKDYAEIDFKSRKCNKDFEIVKVELKEVKQKVGD